MKHFTALVLSATAALLAAHSLPAQQHKAELGTDIQVAYRRVSAGGQSASATQIQLPAGVRGGFFLSPRTSIEVLLTLSYVNPSDDDAFTSMTLAMGPMIHLSMDETRTQGYVRPFVGVNYVNANERRSQLLFGGAAGIKVPAGRHAATRLEIFAFHAPDDEGFPTETRAGANIGFSLFLP